MSELHEPRLVYTGKQNKTDTISIEHENVKDLKKRRLRKIKKLNNEKLYTIATIDMIKRVLPMIFIIIFGGFLMINIINSAYYHNFKLLEMFKNLLISIPLILVGTVAISSFYLFILNDYYTNHHKENEQIFKNNFGYLLDEPRLVYLLNLTVVEKNKQRDKFKISRLYQFLNINSSSKNELVFDMPSNYIIYDVKNEIDSIKINEINVKQTLESIPAWTGSDVLNILNIIEHIQEKRQTELKDNYIPNVSNMPIRQLKQYQEKLKTDYEKYSNDIKNITENTVSTKSIENS